MREVDRVVGRSKALLGGGRLDVSGGLIHVSGTYLGDGIVSGRKSDALCLV